MATSSENVVELGFAEECESWKLRSRYFPSKVGGKPAWLNLKEIPSPASLLCPNCQKSLVFLLQAYAPVDDEARCFHRAIFIFVCKQSSCSRPNSNRNFIVFRNQLSRENQYYSFDPPSEDEGCVSPCVEEFSKVCVVCGCSGPLSCSKCKKAQYCSKDHQVIDWKSGHKQLCSDQLDVVQKSSKGSETLLLPEFEIVTELEPDKVAKDSKTEAELLSEYSHFIKSEKAKSLLPGDENVKDLEELAIKEDKQFSKFIKQIQLDSEQVLRYHKKQEPLWVSSEHIPQEDDIPLCSCGARREFEFQILPQLLNHLHLDSVDESVDWGTLAVYVCGKNCEDGTAYHQEFIWKQDFS